MTDLKARSPDNNTLKDFSLRALLIGAVFGVLFGGANAYLGLKSGLTVSTAIPLAVISAALFKSLERFWGKSSILEVNIAQTTGSSGSSLASGIIFTLPALFLWGFNPSLLQITLLALFGGMLGIVFVIPLRKYLTVNEKANLPYPEGTASAKVIIAVDTGGSSAKYIFQGLIIGAVYKVCLSFARLWPSKLSMLIPGLKKAQLGIEATPALLGVGYILGFRISAILFAGGLLSWIGIIPVIAQFGDLMDLSMTAEGKQLISDMSPSKIWTQYIRYIGAGALSAAGIITVLKSLPMLISSLRIGLKELAVKLPSRDRADKDLSFKIIIGAVILFLFTGIVTSFVFGTEYGIVTRIAGSLTVLFFGFIFVMVSSRIVGLIGVSSNPTSSMTVLTLLCTSAVFYILGWTDDLSKALVIIIGAMVAVSSSIAGAVSQDLKTGYLLGATPKRQQASELFGTFSSALFIAFAVITLGKVYGFGSNELAAPQAMLMKTVVDGVLQSDLPWNMILLGAIFALIAELCAIPSLPFAIGIYLPLSTITPVFIGGLIGYFAGKEKQKKDKPVQKMKADSGLLLGSGLIAGEGITGIMIASYVIWSQAAPAGFDFGLRGNPGEAVSFFMFCLLSIFLFLMARSRKL